MVWVRLDDQFPIHRKIAALSDPAFRLHAAALAWCARNLTDGFVSTSELAQVCAQVRAPEKFAAELVILRVWHLQDEPCPSEYCLAPHTHAENGSPVTGWVIHDYLEYQQPRSKVLRIRKQRAIAGAEGGRRSGEARNRSSAKARTKTEAKPKQVASNPLEHPSRAPTGPRDGVPGPVPAAPSSGSAAYGDRPTPDGIGTPSATTAGTGPGTRPENPAHAAERSDIRDLLRRNRSAFHEGKPYVPPAQP